MVRFTYILLSLDSTSWDFMGYVVSVLAYINNQTPDQRNPMFYIRIITLVG